MAALATILLSGSAIAATGPAFTLTTPALATFPATTTGASSAPQALVLSATRAVTISSIAVATATGAHAEFTTGTTAGCASLASGGLCTIPVTFTPYYTGVRQATLTVTDSTGTVYSVGLSGIGNGPQGLLGPGTVNYNGTTAGSSFAGDGGALSTARFGLVSGTAVDAAGNWYIADTTTHNIRVVYQNGAALACLIEIEEPTLFGLAAGTTSCAGATSAPVAGDIYTIGGDATPYSTSVTAHASGSTANVIATSTGTLLTPDGVAVDASGNVVIADYGTYTIRVIYSGGDSMACLIEVENPTLFGLSASATSCAGATSAPVVGYLYNIGGVASSPGITGDGGKASAALMANVIAVAVSPSGDIFLSDNSTQSARTARLRVIYNGGAQAAALIALESPGTTAVLGSIYKLVGGTLASTGDGGLASSGGLLYSRGMAVDSDGDVVFTDYTVGTEAKVRVVYNGGARMAALIKLENPTLTPTLGYLYTLAGNSGTVASPTTGVNGLASAAVLAEPWGVTLDPAGNIYFADYLNLQVMKIGINDGLLTNYIGQGYVTTKSLTNGNALTKASIWNPFGVAFGSDGTIYFIDYGVYHVRTDTAQTAPITFTTSAPVGSYSETELLYHTNVGTTPLTITSITPSTNFAVVASGQSVYKDCAAATVLAAGQTCAIGVALLPTVANATLTGTLTVKDNSSVGTYAVALTGVSAVQTVTTISSSSPTIAAPTSVTFLANVAIASGQTVPSAAPALAGTVTFKDGTTIIGTAQTIDANGNASVTTATLLGGTHTITATFAPATGDYSTSTAKLTEIVTAIATTTTLTSSDLNASLSENVTLTATVVITPGQTVPSGAPAFAGTVTFTDTSASPALVIASNVAINAAGVAQTSISTLTVGTHTLTAVFTPSAINYATSTGTVSQAVVAVATTTTLTSSIPNADYGASVTLTAAVTINSGQTIPTGTPALTGTVTFTDTSSSPVTVLAAGVAINSAGIAQTSISTLAVGTHVITAVFTPPVVNYAASTAKFSQIVSSPGFNIATTAYGVSVTTGGSVPVPFSIISVGGYKGTVTGSCSSLPANMSCSFAPASVTFTGTDNTLAETVTIKAAAQTSALSHTGRSITEVAALFGAALLFFVPRRRRLASLLMLALGVALTTGLSGCSSSTPTAARGTFNINVTFTDGSTPITTPITVSVLGNGSN